MGSKYRKHQDGFGLVEVLITLAVLLVVISGTTAMINSMFNNVGLMQAKLGQLTLAQDIRLQTSKESVCTPSLIKKEFNPINNSISLSLNLNPSSSNGLVVTEDANLSDTYSIYVEKLRMENISAVGLDLNGNNIYLGDMVLYSRSGRRSLDTYSAPQAVGKLYLSVSAVDSTILSCYNGEDPQEIAQRVCLQLGGTWNNNQCNLSVSRSSISESPSCTGPLPQNYNGTNQQTLDKAQSAIKIICDNINYPFVARSKISESVYNMALRSIGSNLIAQRLFIGNVGANLIDGGGASHINETSRLNSYQNKEECYQRSVVNEGTQLVTNGDGGSIGSETFLCVNGSWVSVDRSAAISGGVQ